jgi:hypothetical protein
MSAAARIVAALIASLAWIGLTFQFVASYSLTGSLGATLATLLWFFTITTNLLVAVVFTRIAARPQAVSPSLTAATTLFILLVGVIYGLLLHGLMELSGGSAVANALLHMATPVAVPLFWFAFTPKGRINHRDPLLWAVYPLGYLIYALIRGEFTHRYPYPFLNMNLLGWGRTMLNAIFIAAAFLAASWLLVWLDSLLGRRLRSTSASIDPK